MKFRLLKVFLLLIILVSVLDGFSTVKNFKQNKGSIRFYDNSGQLFYEYVNDLSGYQTPVSLNSYPAFIPQLAVAAEDRRFYSHFGVDPVSMARSLKVNVASGKVVSGASTITQQVVKNNLAKKTWLSNKYIRKIRQMNSSLYLELLHSKNEILEYYLNNVYLGFNNYGVESASNYYFNKSSKDLNLNEAAVLIGMIKSPEFINPVSNYDRALQSRNEVLRLYARKYNISPQNILFEKSLPIGLNVKKRDASFLHFVDFALNEAKNKLKRAQIKDLAGLNIYTTLDTNLAQYCQNVSKEQINKIGKKNRVSNASVVVLSPKDSAILVLNGSVDYFNEGIDGAVNVAISNRQPGSALKPITYAQAFYENKITPSSLIIDEKYSFKDKQGRSYTPHNYNGVFNGPVTAKVALASSLNLPAVKVLEMIGVEKMVAAANRLGIQTLKDPNRYDLSVTLGGGEVTLLDMSNAYNALARGGSYLPPYSITSIKDSKGISIYTHENVLPKKVWQERSAEIADTMFDILSDSDAKVLGFGRNNVLVLPFPAASKTGTTTDWHDNWTLGYTKDFTVGVWVGNSDNTPMAHIDGVTGAGPIWREIMLRSYETLGTAEKVIDSKLQKPGKIASPKTNYDKTFKIVNPPDGSIYKLSKSTQFERIAFEVSMQDNLTSVEFIINGNSLAKITDKNKKYIWLPKEGTFKLKAIGKTKDKSFKANSTFRVIQE